ncbi:MAG: hypothetical protein AAB794_01340 [Patescibacteria group bacterium]
MEMHDAWFFIGVFVFIFLIWVSTGGPLHPLAFTGPRLSLPQELGGGTYLQFPRASFTIGDGSTSLSGPSSGSRTDTPVPTFVGGSTFGTPSPYRGIVTMSHYVSGAGSTDPKNEYIEISVPQNVSVPVDLSEWRLMSEASGNSVPIPKGTETPFAGTVNAAQDIVLSPGMRAIIVSGSSPIGASFRENKCIGYFSTFQTFYPTLPQNCPVPSDELAAFYGSGYIRDPFCIDYVNKLSRCQVTLTPPVGASGSCQNFLVKYLNYNGCVDAHKNDADFMGNTWRIYLGRSSSMWRTKHELIKLLDANGKTVDAFSY